VQDQGPVLEQEQPAGAGTAEGNPDDYAPAAEPSGDGPVAQVTRGLESGLMTYQEAATKNQIPPLKMDLHVYAPDPRQRFVLVNMRRLTEGQSLPEGVKVDRITTDGAVLSYRGVQFMMERD
jgi:general secretion pathway protein B